jgi:hypothetical protein
MTIWPYIKFLLTMKSTINQVHFGAFIFVKIKWTSILGSYIDPQNGSNCHFWHQNTHFLASNKKHFYVCPRFCRFEDPKMALTLSRNCRFEPQIVQGFVQKLQISWKMFWLQTRTCPECTSHDGFILSFGALTRAPHRRTTGPAVEVRQIYSYNHIFMAVNRTVFLQP